MRIYLKHIVFIFGLLGLGIFTPLKAQQVVVTDSILAKALCQSYKNQMSIDCLKLDTLAASTVTGVLSMPNFGYRDVTQLKYFNNVVSLRIENNNVYNLPDLTKFKNLQVIDVRRNPWIKMSQLEPIKTQLKTLYMQKNAFTNWVKDFSFLNSYTNLSKIKINNFNAEILPDFKNFKSLFNVDITNNKLTFEDLLPLTQIPYYDTIFTLMPQKVLDFNDTIFVYETTPFKITIPYDTAVSGISYLFYKDSVLLQSSTSNVFTIPKVKSSDAGMYYAQITSSHPFFAGKFLNTGGYFLTTSACPAISNIDYIVSEGCNDVQLELKSINTNFYTINVDSLILTNNVLSKSYLAQLQKQLTVPAGNYDVYVKDTNGCAYSISNYINVKLAEKCSDLFSPNGDGLADSFFIDGSGMAIIRNKYGKKVKEISLPGEWDGNDASGKPVEVGIYSITFSNNEYRKVTILR